MSYFNSYADYLGYPDAAILGGAAPVPIPGNIKKLLRMKTPKGSKAAAMKMAYLRSLRSKTRGRKKNTAAAKLKGQGKVADWFKRLRDKLKKKKVISKVLQNMDEITNNPIANILVKPHLEDVVNKLTDNDNSKLQDYKDLANYTGNLAEKLGYGIPGF